MNIKALSIIILVPLITFVVAVSMKDKSYQNKPYQEDDTKVPEVLNKENVPPPNTKLDVSKTYKAVVNTTEGSITIKLNNLDTPITAANFAYLSKIGFYDGLAFHRIIKDFMIQSGDPKGDGTGGPGYYFEDEPFETEYLRGMVAMANSGENTNGSQFFIMHQDNLQMPKNYTIFGKVTEGMDVVDKIANTPVEDNGFGEMSKPVSPVNIVSVDIIEE